LIDESRIAIPFEFQRVRRGASVGHAVTQAGLKPSARRGEQKVHFSMTPESALN
jgi:hypothetical protein